MPDLFEDSPAFQQVEESIRKKVEREVAEKYRKFLAELEEAERQFLAVREEAERQFLAVSKEAERRMAVMHQQTAVAIVSERFPTLKRLAQVYLCLIKQVEPLQQAVLQLALAHDEQEAEDVLLSLHDEEDDEE